MSSKKAKTVVMASLIQTSIGPSSSSTAAAADSTAAASATSVGSVSARPPPSSTSRRAPSSAASLRPINPTDAPSRAKRRTTARPMPAVAPVMTTVSRSAMVRLQHDLDRAVLLLLEHLVGARRLVEREAVGDQVARAERVLLGEQGQDLVGPAAHVRLAHADLDLLVEEVAEWEVLLEADVDARDRERSAAADRAHAGPQRLEPVHLQLGGLEDRVDLRAGGLHPHRVDGGVRPATGHLEHRR